MIGCVFWMKGIRWFLIEIKILGGGDFLESGDSAKHGCDGLLGVCRFGEGGCGGRFVGDGSGPCFKREALVCLSRDVGGECVEVGAFPGELGEIKGVNLDGSGFGWADYEGRACQGGVDVEVLG